MKTVDPTPRWSWDDRLGLARGTIERVVHGSESWRQAQTGRLSDADYWQDVARQLKLSGAQLTQLQQDYFSGDQLDTQLIDYIREQRAAGFTVAMLSNDSRALYDKLTAHHITSLFDPLVVSVEIGVMKPDAAAYHAVLARLQRHAEETIFIDDMPANIEAAAAVGIHAVHYRAGMDLEAALRPLLVIDRS